MIASSTSLGNVTYSVNKSITTLVDKMVQAEQRGDVLWKLPGLLPKAPQFAASQVLLWISKLIMEVNSVS